MSLDKKIILQIEEIFDLALNDNRNTLYEYEVYDILKKCGISVPYYSFIKNEDEIDELTLKEFSNELIIKIVSPQIAHKQKVGGVKKINNTDSLFVKFVINQMRKEVLSYYSEADNKPEIIGFLLVELVSYTPSLGYEVLLGIKDDPAFGPVITMSKGGDDAEFFAKYYDPANLFLPPFTNEESMDILKTLHIRHKFNQIGHPEYLELIARAMTKISQLAYSFSIISDQCGKYIIQSLDINPLVITKDGKFVAIDGFAEFVVREKRCSSLPVINTNNLDGFFSPKGIAVIGVSNDPEKYSLGREIAQLLHDMKREDLYLINNKGGIFQYGGKEYTLYKNLKDIEDNIDLIVYTAPAKFTIDLFKDIHEKPVKSVILISGVPSDIEYSEFAKQLQEIVPQNTRVIGPNCMGVVYTPDDQSKGLNTFFIEKKRLELKYSDFGNTVLLTQSGALAVTELDRLQESKLFKSIVSFGNKYDVKISDLLAFFSENPSVEVISLYIEGFDPGEGRQFFELAKKIKKPIIVYKAGKTEAGAKAAASHTASMTGSYDVFKAACAQAGVILTESIEDHHDLIKTFSLLANRKPKGKRVAGVVNAGFESTASADEIEHMIQANLDTETVEKIKKIDRYGLVDSHTSYLDITPMADDKMYADFTQAILDDNNVDCVFVSIVPHTVSLKTIPETCHDPDGLANLLSDIYKKSAKPIVVSVNAGRYYEEFTEILNKAGIPVYHDIRCAINSLDKFTHFHTL